MVSLLPNLLHLPEHKKQQCIVTHFCQSILLLLLFGMRTVIVSNTVVLLSSVLEGHNVSGVKSD
jgi:hypothetical protein